jgi:hypothetical protein
LTIVETQLPVSWHTDPLGRTGNGPYRLLSGIHRALLDRFEDSVQNPDKAAELVLTRLRQSWRNTEVSDSLGLGAVRNLADFRDCVPIRTFAEHQADLVRVANGERNVTTNERVISLVKSSGTTGTPKLLPVTKAWAKANGEASTLWMLGMIREEPEVVKGKALIGVGAAVEGRTDGGLAFGSNTGRMAAGQPWLVRRRYAVPLDLFRIEEVALRHYCYLRLALATDVRTWTTANPSTLLAFARGLERWREPLAADLRDGTLCRGPAAGLDPALRRRWRRWIRVRGNAPTDGQPWKLGTHWNLKSVNCWRGGSAPFFISRLQAALGASVPIRGVGVSASEGTFGVPLHSSWSGSVLWTGGHLIELQPLDGGDCIWPSQATVGQEYNLVLSTTAGLLRYDMNDIVHVDGFFGRTPVVSFRRKGGDVLSVTGEKLTSTQVTSAVSPLLAHALQVVGFAVGVAMAEVPIYTLVIEARDPHLLPTDLAAQVDAALQNCNCEYKSKRQSGRLAPLIVRWLPAGSFTRFREQRLREGAVDGQVKDLVMLHGSQLDDALRGWTDHG